MWRKSVCCFKKSGGHRPIAVGETLRRWTAKCVAKKATAYSAHHLAPHQLGVGVKGGTKAIIHAASALFLDATIKDEEKWVLQVDFENAFYLVNCSKMLEEIRKHCPKAAKWAETCYASSSHLFFGDKRIDSSSGAQQGDPLASLFFSLVLQPLIKKIRGMPRPSPPSLFPRRRDHNRKKGRSSKGLRYSVI